MKTLLIAFVCFFSLKSQAEGGFSDRIKNWPQWAKRPHSENFYQQIRSQMTATEDSLLISGPLQMTGQYHKRPGQIVIAIATINYPGQPNGTRAAKPKLQFAEFIAAVLRIREEHRAEFPAFRVVVNTPFENEWLKSSLEELGFTMKCDAILSGNPKYVRMAWDFP